MARKSNHAFIFVLITVFLDMVGFGIIIPVLPKLIEDVGHLDLSGAAVIGGWMFVAFSLAQFLFAPLAGNLSDRFGRRPLLLLAIFGLGMDYVLSALAPDLTWLFVGRILAGICGSSWVVANAFIADVTAPAERAKAYGMLSAAFGAGFVIGPAIGGLLGEFGPRVPFWVAAGVSMLNLLYGMSVMPETLAPENRRSFDWRRANPFGVFKVFRTYPGILPLCGVLCLFNFASAVYPAIWPFWGMAKFGWTEAMIGITLAAFGLIMALFQGILTGPAVARWGEVRVAIAGILCAVTAALGYGFVASFMGIILLMLIHGPEGFVHPMMMSIMSRSVPENAQGELQGGISAATSLALLTGTLSFTQIFSYFMKPTSPFPSPDIGYFVASALFAVALLWFIAIRRKIAPKLQ